MTTRRSNQNDKIRIDPIFNIPEGSEEAFTFTREGTDEPFEYELDYYLTGDGFDFAEEEFDFVDSEPGIGITLDTPLNLVVVSQQLRRAPGGMMVVDVTIEFDDVNGATDYQVQVTSP